MNKTKFFTNNKIGENMCTCINVFEKNNLFGRTLDIEYSFNEKILLIPRQRKIVFKKRNNITTKYAIYGIGTIIDNYPLFADASNEMGLSFAGLNFVGNAFYNNPKKDKNNLTPYELPLFLLGSCKNLKEVKTILKNINLINLPLNKKTPLSELHFMMSYRNESIVIESTIEGLIIYENPYSVLTNNPNFKFHEENLSLYMNLSSTEPKNNLTNIPLKSFTNGLGSVFLPGDYSSPSRFIKVFFIKEKMIEKKDITAFFKCLDSVSLLKGVVITPKGNEYTLYTSCYDVKNNTLYYRIYGELNYYSVSFSEKDFNETDIKIYEMKKR